MLTTDQCYELVEGLLKFPYSQVCVHLVACNILDIMQRNGYELNDDLVKHVVNCNDSEALAIVRDIRDGLSK